MKPNILWIYCDELRPDGLGCCEMRDCPDFPRHTPHLDRMAADGTRYTRHYCNSPICTPSRACILTGNYCEQHGVYGNEGYWPGFRSPVKLPTLYEHFTANGYDTANFGKVHFPRDWPQWPHDEQAGGEMNFWAPLGEEGVEMIRKLGRNGRKGGMVGGCYPDSEPYPPRQVVDNAMQWLNARDASRPWLARLSILQPHTPVLPPAAFRHLYDDIPWPRKQSVPPGVSTYQKLFAEMQGYEAFPPELMAQAARDYYALCAWVDSEVGRKAAPNGDNGDWLDGRGWPRRTCIRTSRYRYDRNVRIDGLNAQGEDQDAFLADSLLDPAETVNLVNDTAHSAAHARLERLLQEHIKGAVEVDPAYLKR